MAMSNLQHPDVDPATVIEEDDRDQPLYKARDKVYPKRVSGRFRNLKWFALIALLAIYWVCALAALGPWAKLHRIRPF